MRTVVVLLCALVVGVVTRPVAGAPEADLISSSWQLDVEFHDPQRISVVLPGDTEPTMYWYVLYRVTNNSRQEVGFYPSVELVTDTLETVRAGDMISPRVYDAIAARHNKEYPFFSPPSKASGPLLQGRENARTTVAVFRMFDSEASSFTVYFSGLSGDIERVGNPTFRPDEKESEQNARVFLFRRTLAVRYDLPGDVTTRARAVPVRRSREWVMR